ncbi:hypothetical protein LTSEWAN_6033 [Salmonella enterica subsp. enterica serovar Wandsworth str. A4-580]|uniref:Uncharacterized protein n=1 Tax=Salmonella enterica subsp. enterica serovar Wandsworth str. A4-580 TaxID=913086 RepID=G5SJT5_SALET|nr:hypothetical protein LTSEWAN_6033 [Salmonella enterica subsp. enterica serovar Wandsworth str. A4-580]
MLSPEALRLDSTKVASAMRRYASGLALCYSNAPFLTGCLFIRHAA